MLHGLLYDENVSLSFILAGLISCVTFAQLFFSRARLSMSQDGARAAFVGAFFEVVAPNIKEVSVAIEVPSSLRNCRAFDE